MDLYTVFGIGHIIGIALGVGGASVSDVFFIRILRSRLVSRADFENLRVLSRIVWAGITTLIVSGAGFLWQMNERSGSIGILNSDRFLAKLTIVAIIFINGLVFHFIVFPKIRASIGKKRALAKHISLLATTGALSGASWYSVVLIAMLRDIDLPFAAWLGSYLVVVSGGIVTARYMMKRLLK